MIYIYQSIQGMTLLYDPKYNNTYRPWGNIIKLKLSQANFNSAGYKLKGVLKCIEQ